MTSRPGKDEQVPNEVAVGESYGRKKSNTRSVCQANKMDAGVELPYLLLRPSAATGQPQSGFSDVIFKFKHRFYEREKKDGEHEQSERSLAYQVAYSQPTGREDLGLGAGTARVSARLLGTTEWESTELNANIGYDSSGKAPRRGNFVFDYAVSLSIAAKYERPKPWEPVVELTVIRVKGADGYDRLVSMLAGMIYEPSEEYYIDAGVRVGLTERSEDYVLVAGFGLQVLIWQRAQPETVRDL